MKTVGIDIGSYSIKIAELSNSGSSIHVDSLNEHPLSQKPGVDKELDLITTLRDVLSHYNRENTTFVLGLPQDRISTRTLFFPFKEKFKILKSLPFELEDLVPFASHGAVFEGKIVKSLPNGSEILAVAAPKDLVKSYLDLSSDVQIDPQIISLEGFALNNLFEDVLAPPAEGETNTDWEGDDYDNEKSTSNKSKNIIPENTILENGEAILDIGHSSSILIVRSNGSLRNLRRINWGSINLAKALVKKKNIQELEALQNIKASQGIILNRSLGSEADLELSDILSQEVTSLGRTLKLTLLEIKGVNSLDIKGIGLIGGLASLANLGPKLTESTLIACNKILKIKNHPEIDVNTNANNELSMGVAIGLALEAYRRPKNPPINFRKDEFAKDNSTFTKAWGAWSFYVNLAAASIAVFFIYSFLRNSISEELNFEARRHMKSAASDIFQIKKHNATEPRLNKLFTALEKREKIKSKIIEFTRKFANDPLVTLKKISEKASSRSRFPMDIKNLKVDKKSIAIQGNTTAKSELQKFTRKLKNLAIGKISKIERPGANGSIDFTITFKPKKRL